MSQENLSLKGYYNNNFIYLNKKTLVSGSTSGKEEGPVCNCDAGCTHEKDSTKSSPQLSQTNDSAYGSRGSIQSPNRSLVQLFTVETRSENVTFPDSI